MARKAKAVFSADSYRRLGVGVIETHLVFDLQPPIQSGDVRLDRLRFEKSTWVTGRGDIATNEIVSGRGTHNGRLVRMVSYTPAVVDEIMLRFTRARSYDFGMPDNPYQVAVSPSALRGMLERSGG